MSRSLAATCLLLPSGYLLAHTVVNVFCVGTDDNAHEPFTRPNSCRQSLNRGSVWMNGGRRIAHPLMGDTNKSKG
ncbi:hypothetical protein BDR06DRAFT_950401 [Suillus hirtellus]|nr:hypothetical protein BDR06DRAFT_950401 [Suillus hirtellus]